MEENVSVTMEEDMTITIEKNLTEEKKWWKEAIEKMIIWMKGSLR